MTTSSSYIGEQPHCRVMSLSLRPGAISADETEVDVAPATTIHMSSAAIPEYTTAPESPQTMHLLQDDVLQVPPNPPIPPGMPTPSPSWIYPPSSEPSPSPTDPGIVNVPDASPRRSTFMGLFSPRSRDTSTPQGGGHRPSHSASGSLLSMNLPRKKSTATLNSTRNLTSPSSLSVNSISAPLTHTLVRTEFGYPKSGPTPEQLRLISSRESIARFGRPYGPDAIAFAASTSRQELPPDFEQVELAQTPVHVVRGSPEPLEFSSGLDFATSAADQGSEGRHLATSAERSPTLPQHSRLAASTSRPLSGASSSTSESAGAYATADESSTMHETDDPDPLRQ